MKINIHVSKILFVIFIFLNTQLPHPAFSQKIYNKVDWGAYFGDPKQTFDFSQEDFTDDIKVDHRDSDNFYICGRTVSSSGSYNPCTGIKMFFGGGGDAFLAKYDRCGNLIWSRYFGEENRGQYAYRIALDYDSLGRTIVYIAGEMPTMGLKPVVKVCDGGPPVFRSNPTADNDDAFIAKYDADGNLMRWTYFGGGIDSKESLDDGLFADQILGMTIYNHNIYTVGYTSSLDMYKGALKFDDTTFHGGEGDGFLGEFTPNLDTLLYFTYIGGNGQDRCHDIKIYKSHADSVYLFIDGTTPSPDMAYGPAYDLLLGGIKDAFLGRWSDKSGAGVYTRDWVTYVGGPNLETGRDIDLDTAGNVFMTGWTSSALPFWKGAHGYDSTFNSTTDSLGQKLDDAYVIKVPFNGSKPIWGTYIGGYNEEQVCGLIFKPDTPYNHVIIAGYTGSANQPKCTVDSIFPFFPLYKPVQNKINGSNNCPGENTRNDVFISELTDRPDSQQLVFSTYLGGGKSETNGPQAQSYSPSLALGSHNELYVAFNTLSDDIDTVLDSSLNKQIWYYQGGGDAYVAKLISKGQNSCYQIATTSGGNENRGTFNVRAFPVPFHDQLNVELNVPQAGSAVLSVYDLFGREISMQNISVNSGTNTFTLNMNGGDQFYMLKVSYQQQSYWLKVVKN